MDEKDTSQVRAKTDRGRFKATPWKERFESKVFRFPATNTDLKNLSCSELDALSAKDKGCHLWTGKTLLGYGRLWAEGKTQGVHRLAYELRFGKIPKNMEIDHLCRNRACVNPDHLEVVTCGENVLRGKSLQAFNKAKTQCVRGHEFTPENTRLRKRPGGGRKCRACAREDAKRYRKESKTHESL